VVLLRLTVEALGSFKESGYEIDWLAVALAGASLAALLWKNINSIWLLLIGAGVGMLRAWVFHKTGA